MERLYQQYGGNDVAFFMIYSREAHPDEEFPHHTSFEQKWVHALECQRQKEMNVPILVDRLDGGMHEMYGSLPNMVYIIDKEGLIIYKSAWTIPDEIENVLKTLMRSGANFDAFF